MKKWFSLVAIAVLCLTLVIGAACGGGDGDGDGDGDGEVREIKAGFGCPLTGIYGSVIGIPGKNAFELTAKNIGVFEVGGEDCRWKVYTEDNQGGSAPGGVASATKFIYENHVEFMHQIGGMAAAASQGLCEGAGILLDMGTTTFDAFGPDHPYSIQTGPCVQQLVGTFYHWLAETHPEVKKIVIAAADDPVGAAYTEAWESKMHEYYGFEREIVWIPAGTTEYFPTATAIMAKDPDCVLVSSIAILDVLWDMGYDGLGAPGGPIMDLTLFEDAGWDDCKGTIVFFPEWYAGVWPEATAFAEQYEPEFGVECGTVGFWAAMVTQALTGILEKAGTVDDLDKIIETVESGVSFDSMMGPVYFGGEAFVGVNHLLMWPQAIWEVVGDHQYKQLAYYTPEEAEAIAVEAWEATMK
ncbi:MAG: ABC transporter substrate-binding protein [Dehalococcoidia bacterium]|jgi:ABC-type branched-subunit amino acid transport system substrate-binding protein|nr:ABC transporter substrate-binding protein [Dehalococcoidia bacterium]